MLKEPATGYSKITTDWIIEPELNSYNTTEYELADQLTTWLANLS